MAALPRPTVCRSRPSRFCTGDHRPEAWIENVFLEADGSFHFTKGVLSVEDVTRLRDILIATGANAENVDKYIAGGVNVDDVVDSHGIPRTVGTSSCGRRTAARSCR